MRTRYDLSQLDWTLSGWTPHLWRMEQTMEIGASPNAELPGIPASVPGSVQHSLREAGLLTDWNVGLNYRECEWVENRHWIYEVAIPDDWVAPLFQEQASGTPARVYRLNCRGLDYCGSVTVNGQMVAEFCGSHVPHVFDITLHLCESGNVVRIIFDLPPRWLGQFGYTSRMTDWKPRFNYTWDWTPRLVQTAIWDSVFLDVTDGKQFEEFRCRTEADHEAGTGRIIARGSVSAGDGDSVAVSLTRDGSTVAETTVSVAEFGKSGIDLGGFAVDLWWPNMMGEQPLYDLTVRLLDASGSELDRRARRVGFKNVTWAPCEGAPPEATPWICVVNGRPVFLQGINWTPILPNFADVTEQDYRKRVELYRDLGLNMLRVWGGASLEKQCFYNLCDEMGLMVWQEFPLSSSGIENWPPEDQPSADALGEIAESYITRRQHHVSLTMWCGGNELQGSPDGLKTGSGKPCDLTHPLLDRLREITEREDPGRRFLATSPSGPVFYASPENFGKGLHWHVHGPWKAGGDLAEWHEYFAADDSCFRSETGAPGASSVEIIRRYAGDCDVMPATTDNPLWRRPLPWWIEWDQFVAERGREPGDIEEYVEWSQDRQAQALVSAIGSCKDRFPRCGGFIIWMGHDCYPCTANTSIVDFEGNPKPAALALKEIWRR